jgi:hypothetical protein
MTKKQSQKKKISVKLNPGEAVFTADIEVMNHIMGVYHEMSLSCKNPTEAQSWMDVVNNIKKCCEETYYSNKSGDIYEEEW